MLKSTEILNTINTKMETIKNLAGEEKKAVFEEIKNLKSDYEMELELEKMEKETFENKVNKGEATKVEDNVKGDNKVEKVNIKNAFAKVIAGKEVTDEERKEIKNLLVEGDATKGGVGVPADISTDIQVYQDQTRNFDIRPYIEIEPVSTMKGSRPYATNQPQASGFASLDEGAEIQELYEPTFDDMNYIVRKYGGFTPLTNELLEDSTYAIYNYIVKWLAENELNTYAYQVLNGTGNKSAQGIMTEVTSTTGILKDRTEKATTAPTIRKFKSIINKDLETVSKDNLRIFTNADGYDYLDGLEDAQGHGYLQTDATKKSGFAFLGYEIVKVPSKFLANVVDGTDTLTPFIVGDLRQLYKMFDRKQMSVQSTNIGGDTWKTDTTQAKGIFRFDGKIKPANIEAVKVLLAKLA